MSLESQLERLNTNIEALVGAIAASTSIKATAAAAPAPAAATTTEKPAKPRKAKTEAPAAAAPVASTLGVSAEQVAEDLKQAPAAAPAAEAPQANDDPFGDLNAGETAAPTYTIDDVREAALKLRDATDMDKAKAFIAKFGVDSIKYLPEDKFADFITKANAAIKAAKNADL